MTITTRDQLAGARRIVVKIGSALLTAEGRGLDGSRLGRWSAQMAALHGRGLRIVLVSSGAVAEGLARLGWARRPERLSDVQAAASVGQAGLVEAYSRSFEPHGLRTAQVLLTHDDVAHRGRYLNARRTLLKLLELGVVPIVNENDAVTTDETRVGDNDTMAALTANLIGADAMVILTDQDGVFDADPRESPDATRIECRDAHDAELLAGAAGSAGTLGRGGMRTKVMAARQAADSGAATVIANGLADHVLDRITRGEAVGTLLVAGQRARRAARKNWIAGQRRVRGRVRIDAGAASVLRDAGRSLLPIGMTAVEGDFRRGDLVACIDPQGVEIAQGLANYDARDARLLLGQPSERISALLGYGGEPEFIHRDNLVVSR